MSYSLPADWKYCLTCRKWGGNRRPTDPFCNCVECFSSNDKGKCYGGGFNQSDVQANFTCNKWEPQYKK